MNQEERLQLANQLIQYLTTYNTNGEVEMSMETRQQLKALYADLFGVYNAEVMCSSCVLHYLSMIQSWYQREYPIWLSQQPKKTRKKP